METIGGFFSGMVVGIAAIIGVGLLISTSERVLCSANHYQGAACQCRIIIYGDKAP